MILFYVFLVLFLISILFFFITIFNKVISIANEYIHVNKGKIYNELLTYYCDFAYQRVYKDQIISYSSSGYKLDGTELETTTRNFIKLVHDIMGPQLVSYYYNFFGNIDSFNKNITLWLFEQVDKDELLTYVRNQEEQPQEESLRE